MRNRMQPDDTQRAELLNFDGWIRGWVRDEPDYAVGERVLEALRPVAVHMLDRGLALSTVRRHYGWLRLLGQKVLDKLTQFPEAADDSVDDVLDDLLLGCAIGEGGPDIYAVFASEQREFDTLCRLVYKFRSGQKQPASLAA